MLQCNYAALFHPDNGIVGRQAAAAQARCSSPPAPTSTATSPPTSFKQDSSLGIGYWADDSGACGPLTERKVYLPRTHPICPTSPSVNPWRRGKSYFSPTRQAGFLDGRAVIASYRPSPRTPPDYRRIT